MNSAPAASIFMYHSISEGPGPTRTSPALFRAQLAALADAGCTVLSLDDAGRRLRARRPLPPRVIVLTFDDGYVDFASAAFPALQEHGWTATLFVPSGRVGGRSDWPGVPPADVMPLLGWSDLEALAARGVEIGSHGVTHADLTGVGAAEAHQEIGASQSRIQERLGRPVPVFAFPFGRSTPALRAVAARRYTAAVGTRMRRAAPGVDVHDLPRIDMHYFRDPRRLRRFVEGGAKAYFNVRRILRRAGQAVRG
jgi:peptidoglycan/xylan/chitin deacetylase (PgdA/CDA1 family)